MITCDRFAGRSALTGRIRRYTLGSIVAAGISALVFASLFLLGVGTTADSIVAFVAGAIPNWFLNRRWTWRRRGRPEFWREVVAYALTSTVSLVAASVATAWTRTEVQGLHAHSGLQALLVTASYLAVVGVLFVARFAVYELWIFSARDPARPSLWSRRQVLKTARANRTP